MIADDPELLLPKASNLRSIPWSATADAIRRLKASDDFSLALLARVAVQGGNAGQAAGLLVELGFADQYRPIYEALRTAASGADHLLTIAPEVREPAAKIHRWLTFRREHHSRTTELDEGEIAGGPKPPSAKARTPRKSSKQRVPSKRRRA